MNSSSETTNNTPIIGGTHANTTGNNLEAFLSSVLLRANYTKFEGVKAQAFENRGSLGGKQFIHQCLVGNTVYDTDRFADFFIVNKDKFPDDLIIECKWQQSAGSVDEKYPYLVVNIMKTAIPTIVLIDGGGYKQAAIAWLKNQVDPNRALIGVYTMAEFQKIVNNGLFN